MDFSSLNALADQLIAFVTNNGGKDKQISDLLAENTTLKATCDADDAEIKTLQDKFAQLQALVNGSSNSTSDATSGTTPSN